MQPYESDFSSLQLVGKDQENEYLYHDDFKVVYQFKNNKIVNEICLVDKYTKKYPDLQNIKDVIDKIIKQEDDENILEYLYEHELIGEKTHKKIKRKLDSVAVVENPVEKLKKEGLGPGNCRGRKRKERPCKFPPYHIY